MQEIPKSLIVQPKFKIKTKEDIGKVLLMIKQTKVMMEEFEKQAKERAKEIMEAENVSLIELETLNHDSGEVQKWEIRKSEASSTQEYRPEKVIAAIGVEAAAKFLKVKGGELKKYLTAESAKGRLSMSKVEEAVSDPIISTRKGMLTVREIKPKA